MLSNWIKSTNAIKAQRHSLQFKKSRVENNFICQFELDAALLFAVTVPPLSWYVANVPNSENMQTGSEIV